jgi:hypothetical protein
MYERLVLFLDCFQWVGEISGFGTKDAAEVPVNDAMVKVNRVYCITSSLKSHLEHPPTSLALPESPAHTYINPIARELLCFECGSPGVRAGVKELGK